jgi:DNA-binding CsgD family transcriptional regulator
MKLEDKTIFIIGPAAEATARRASLHVHDQLRRQVHPWLERGRFEMAEVLRDADHIRTSPLSAREREIADHVAQGLTNREIAQRLFISTRTVESHVDHIKAKLGFRRRARIVAWALDRANGNGPGKQPNPERLRMTAACGPGQGGRGVPRDECPDCPHRPWPCPDQSSAPSGRRTRIVLMRGHPDRPSVSFSAGATAASGRVTKST